MELERGTAHMTAKRRAGLTGFDLKIIALALMVLDHIHYFFEFTGAVPLLFTQLGRLSAGLFLFSVVEGFVHTHDRKKYFLRIYPDLARHGAGIVRDAGLWHRAAGRHDPHEPDHGKLRHPAAHAAGL